MKTSDTTRIPMARPDITQAEREAVMAVLESPWLSIGPRLEEFERLFAEYVGAAHAIGVSSGTAGLHAALIAAGVEEGDAVITTPFSFIASANVILYQRAEPIFVDVDPSTGNIDPRLVDQAMRETAQGRWDAWLPPALAKSGYRPRRLGAVLPVHAFGQPAEMDAIRATARRFEVPVIEDACEAVGSQHNGKNAGKLGDAAVFAFYPNKQMTTGEGGMIVTDRADWADVCRSLRNQGRDVFNAWLSHARLGFNYRLDELSAALGAVQLRRLDEMNARRSRVAGWYGERLAEHPLVETPQLSASTSKISWFVYVVRIHPPADRNRVMLDLERRGVPSRPYFSPIHLQPFFQERYGYRRSQFPVTEQLGDVSLALPFFSRMTEDQVDAVCRALIESLPPTQSRRK